MFGANFSLVKMEIAVFGGGCFWCVEAVFQRVEGVDRVVSGYSGGSVDDPSYEEVKTGETGHAEVVKVDYDPTQVSFTDLLEYFFGAHDPTQMNRQGPDIGSQYRSIIFYTSEEQRKEAEQFIEEKQSNFEDPIVTEVERLEDFYRADDYHQDFYDNHKGNGYSRQIIEPKLDKIDFSSSDSS